MTLRLSGGRIATFHVSALGALLVIASTSDMWPLRVVYNASASVPLGWYRVNDSDEPKVGDVVVARPPLRAERLLVERGYIGSGVPLLKVVMAREGARVCREGDAITIDAAPVGTARDRDGLGRPLPRWSGCRVLGSGEIFLFNRHAPGSFDGRYFGPVSVTSIIGKATPLWTW
jgi:conjugative transfer signal peptidase TraF